MRVTAKFLSLAVLLAGVAVAGPALATDKTLVSWVCLANTTQQGGSALTIQSGDHFDGIVFGERVAGKWMAGSEGFARTQGDQQANAVEKADDKTLVQMAIVYKGSQIAIYRNGELYASYEASNVELLKTQSQAVFGLRHEGAGPTQTLKGSIEEARIYEQALTADEIKKLEPNTESAIKPYAWWTFETGKETDRMGRFPVNTLSGGAKIEGGRLFLASDGATLIAAGKAAHTVSPDGLVTPGMPENPPANWLTYHLIHPGPGRAEPGDPNCAFYWKGRYHLFYIYGQDGGPAFAHVSSTDMVHWKWHPTTLTPKSTGHGMFSGTGFITKEGKPAIIYHGWWSGKNQMAFALDDNLEKWTKPQPVMPEPINGKLPEMRYWDPDCWLNGDTYYTISGGSNPPLMKSKDLQKWDYIGELFHKDFPANLDTKKGDDISCGNMFKIGNKWMLLCINHGRGCRYYLGDFKDEKYLPDFHAMMSWNGNNFFAPESVLTKDGRRVMWAWIMGLPISPTGVQSLPRELELPKDGALRIRPLKELEELRYGKKQEKGITVKSDAAYTLKEVNGDALELEVTVKAPVATEFGLDVLCDKECKNGLRIAIVGDSKLLKVGKVEAPFELKKDEELVLRVFIDKNFVEVFANDRQAAVSAAGAYVQANTGVTLFSKGGDTVVTRVRSWKMKSIYPKGKPEAKNQAMAGAAVAEVAKAGNSQKKFKGPVKVFILAGQSNMEGHGGVMTLDSLGEHPTHGYLLKKVKNSDGSFVVRDDVFVSYQKGAEKIKRPLSVGMGAWGKEWFGPELMFGMEMGDFYKGSFFSPKENPVLLIKTCWGGHSLYGCFRPPSAGKAAYEIGDWPKPEDVGASYHKMVKEVRECLANMDTDFPQLKGLKTEICGFVWFQGWNDLCAPDNVRQQVYDEYCPNFVHMVQDLRAEFKVPNMPAVAGELGVGGEKATDKNLLDFRAAQAKIAMAPELKGRVGYVRTAPFWYPELDELPAKMEAEGQRVRTAVAAKLNEQMKGKPESADPQKMEQLIKEAGDKALEEDAAYQQAKKECDKHVCNWGCHYQGSARVYCMVGYSLAEAIKPLL